LIQNTQCYIFFGKKIYENMGISQKRWEHKDICLVWRVIVVSSSMRVRSIFRSWKRKNSNYGFL
jgi:hypothetical protein